MQGLCYCCGVQTVLPLGTSCSSFVAFLLKSLDCVPFLTLISQKQGISISLGRVVGVTWVNSCWACDPSLVTILTKVIFAITTYSLSVYASTLVIKPLNELTHLLNLMWCKFSIFISLQYPNFLTPKILKMCDPILVTLIKMQPHNSQFSREGETPFNDTPSFAYYQEVPPPRALFYLLETTHPQPRSCYTRSNMSI